MILALSSTAIVMQTLTEKKLTHTEGGRASLAVLLFQDVAALPLLALMPLLAFGSAPGVDEARQGAEALEEASPWMRAALVVAAVALVVLAGRYLTGPVYRFLALARLPEIQVAGALLMIVGISLVMSLLGLSPALGSFLAGVVLANSPYRHQLEADLAPFKGLLLGLFFMTVGAGVDLAGLAAAPARLVALTVALMGQKMAVLWPLARLFGLRPAGRALFTLALAQAGEFGFVLLAFAETSRVLGRRGRDAAAGDRALDDPDPGAVPAAAPPRRRLVARARREAPPIEARGSVIVAGMGRFGQTVNRVVAGLGHPTVVIDGRPEVVERLRRLGIKGYFGELDRPEVLAAAGIAEAKAVVVAIDDPEQAVRHGAPHRSRHPTLPVIVRARDRHHVYELVAAGATATVREVFHGGGGGGAARAGRARPRRGRDRHGAGRVRAAGPADAGRAGGALEARRAGRGEPPLSRDRAPAGGGDRGRATGRRRASGGEVIRSPAD